MSSTAYTEAIAEKLNSGLVRLVSVRRYPVLQKGKFSKHKKMRRGAVFQIGALHRQPLTEEVLKRNRRGYFNAQLNTVAHAPSLYHWLFHRCGIPFEETQMLIQTSGLRMNGSLVQSLDEAEVQRPWIDWQKLEIDVRTTNPLAVHAVKARNMSNRRNKNRDPDSNITSGSSRHSIDDNTDDRTDDHCLSHENDEAILSGSSSPALAEKDRSVGNRNKAQGEDNRANSGNAVPAWVEDEHVFVPALQRALHRRYFFQFLHRGISLSSQVEDPRSFVHRMIPSFFPSSSCETLGLNHLHPMGLITGVKGLGIVSNDVSMIRYWNNAFLGNYGVYDVRFMAGTPRDVMEAAQKRLEAALQESVMTQSPEALLEGEKQTRSPSSSPTPFSSPGSPLGVIPSCRCTLERVPPASRDWIAEQQFFSSSSSSPRKESTMKRMPAFSSEGRLSVTTPLFPYREIKKLWRVGAMITLIRSGPFSLPDDLAHLSHRQLTVEELALLFAFERKLKVNRMILSLKEFDADTNRG